MTALRELRRAADLSQQEFAALIDVPLNTLRMRLSMRRSCQRG
jgi:DNA-binding transcriptional regulator YiaG